MTTRAQIKEWLDNAEETDTHVIIVTDTFNYEDYPVYASGLDDLYEKQDKYSQASMQKIMEVYDLSKDKV